MKNATTIAERENNLYYSEEKIGIK